MDTILNTFALISSISVIVLAYIFVKITLYIHNYIKISTVLKKFPHDPLHWFWGNLKEFPKIMNEESVTWKRERCKRYPDGCLTWFGPFLSEICLTSAKGVKPILKSAEPKGFVYRFLQPWLGDGLLLSKGQKWARNRRLLTSAFHFEILKSYLQIKNRSADVLCSKINKYAENVEYFDECSPVTMYSLDVILKCAFSYETNCQDTGDKHPYVLAVKELGRIINDRFMKPWLHVDWIFYLTADGKQFKKQCDYVHKIAEDVIAQRKKALEQKMSLQETLERKRYTDFMDILLMARDENNVGLTDKEIREEVDTFLFAGHDTTASAIYWALYSLSQYGQIQDRVQREIDNLMTDRQTDDLLAPDFAQLPYLSMCLKESLRLHSTVSFIQRVTEHDFNICGKLLPKETQTSIYIYSLHHNPTVWEDSLEFRPERFSPENVEKMDPFSYVPFSAGPRNCIGQNFAMHEIKVAIVKVLRRFFLDVDPNHAVRKLECLVMRAEHGIKLKATQRRPGEYRFK